MGHAMGYHGDASSIVWEVLRDDNLFTSIHAIVLQTRCLGLTNGDLDRSGFQRAISAHLVRLALSRGSYSLQAWNVLNQ